MSVSNVSRAALLVLPSGTCSQSLTNPSVVVLSLSQGVAVGQAEDLTRLPCQEKSQVHVQWFYSVFYCT